MISITQRAIGAPLDRIDGPKKVTGTATYAFEHAVDEVTYAFPVQSTIAKGRIISLDTSAAQAISGVITVLTYENAPRLEPQIRAELAVLQSNAVAYRGQFVALVVAETLEVARQAADTVVVRYEEQPHSVVLRDDRSDLYKPEKVNPAYETDTVSGDVEAALASAAVSIDHTYTTPAYHNNPLEPHATIARWSSDGVTLYDSNQGSHMIRDTVAQVFGLEPERVRVISPYVGGAFGSKGTAHPHVILTVMAAQVVGRPVKCALARQHMFAVVGYRTPTIQRLRLGSDNDGRLTAIAHDVVEQTSTLQEFAEQTAVVTRMMYAAPNRSTTHRLARLDVPTPAWMRAPGECPGMFALESAMDELAIACGLDPIELRVRNEPRVDPETGHPFSSRGLVACLREGARRFGWQSRNPQPGMHTDGRWLIGTGVAASTYPTRRRPSTAITRVDREGRYSVLIDASDIGNGAWTVLTQIAADALDVPLERVHLEIGDTRLPRPGRRLDGNRLVGNGHRRSRPQAPRPPAGRTRRHSGGGTRSDWRGRRESRGEAVCDARLWCAICRGPRSPRYRRGARSATAGRLRRRSHHERKAGPFAVARRYDHGAVHGTPRGKRHGPALRGLREP